MCLHGTHRNVTTLTCRCEALHPHQGQVVVVAAVKCSLVLGKRQSSHWAPRASLPIPGCPVPLSRWWQQAGKGPTPLGSSPSVKPGDSGRHSRCPFQARVDAWHYLGSCAGTSRHGPPLPVEQEGPVWGWWRHSQTLRADLTCSSSARPWSSLLETKMGGWPLSDNTSGPLAQEQSM